MSLRARIAAGGVVLAVGAVLLASQIGAAFTGSDGIPFTAVERGRFEHRVEAEGVLVAEQATVLATPRAAGGPMKIAWLAPDGTEVREGEVVIRYDPSDMERELFDGQTARDKALGKRSQKSIEQETTLENLGRDAEMADLQLEHARTFQTTDESIYSRREIIESQIDQTLATRRKSHAEESRELRGDLGDIELDLLELEEAKAQITIDKAQSGLNELEVRAPHAGIFVLRTDRGEPSTVGTITYPGFPVAEIPQLDAMKAQVFVLEADAGGVEPGVAASVVLDAHPGEPIEATVRRVDAVPKRRARWSPVQYFEVELELAFTDPERMKPGQRLRATLLIQDLDDVLSVPREAIFRDDAGEPFVYRRDGDDWFATPVTLGPTALGRVVIEQGVEAGDVLALQNPESARRDGSPSEPAAAPLGPTGATR